MINDDFFCIVFQDASIKQTAQLMYPTALMESEFILSDPKDFASCIYSLVKTSLKINLDAAVEEEEDAAEADMEPKTKEAASSSKSEEDECTEPSAVKDEL